MTTDELALPSALMPLATFKERIAALHLKHSSEGYDGGSSTLIFEDEGLRLRIEHSGFGAGYGGERPVRVLRFRIERPYAAQGSLLAGGALQRATMILRALTAPAPTVHDFHPEAIRLRVLAFCEAENVKRCRIVRAPSTWRERLGGASTAQRFTAYATYADALGTELSIYLFKRPGPWPVLFRGKSADLAARMGELIQAIGDSPIRIECGAAADALVVKDPFTITRETVTLLSDRIATAKLERCFTRLEVDAEGAAALHLKGDLEAVWVKAQLESLTKQAESFNVVIDGTSTTTKRGKLTSLATSLRAAAKAGKSVAIHPVGMRAHGAELEF